MVQWKGLCNPSSCLYINLILPLGAKHFLCRLFGRQAQPRVLLRQIASMSAAEAACTYAALVLHDDNISVTAEKIAALVSAANVNVDSYWPTLFAKLLEKRTVGDLIASVGSGGGGAAVSVSAAPAAGAGAAPPVVEEKKEEPKEESDEDMGFGLFD